MPDDEQHPTTVAAQVNNTATGEVQDVVVDLTTGAVVSDAPISENVQEFFAAFGSMIESDEPDPD